MPSMTTTTTTTTFRAMPDLPSHISPVYTPKPLSSRIPEYSLDPSSSPQSRAGSPPPPNLISPAFTPPLTPESHTPTVDPEPVPVPDNATAPRPQKLLQKLPEVECIVRARIPTVTGAEMFLHVYQNSVDNKEHLAIVFGSHIRSKSMFAVRPGETERDRMTRGAYEGRLHPGRVTSRAESTSGPGAASEPFHDTCEDVPPLVRIHSECYTGETAWSARCDCGEQLDEAARLMSLPSSTGGVIVYLRQEGRGIGLGEKLKAYNLQDLGSDTVEANLLLRHPADARSYGLATAMLLDLDFGGDRGIRLLTNNPDKVRAVEGPHQEIVVKQRVPMVPLAWKTGGKKGINSEEIEGYLKAKIGKMGHMIE
ncbi:GTP cyclohydrolase II [Xanthoria calcicola]